MNGTDQVEINQEKSQSLPNTARRFLIRYWPVFTTLLTLALAIAAQILVQGQERVTEGVLLFLAAIIYFVVTIWIGPPVRLGLYPDPNPRPDTALLVPWLEARLIMGVGVVILAVVAYLGFANNQLLGNSGNAITVNIA